MENKTHWRKLTNPDYIGAYSLMVGETSPDIVVTIESVSREIVTGTDGKKEECTVARLKGQKPFILNSTNQKTISKALGSPFIEDWVGKSITLYVAKVKAFGEVVDALRVRPVAAVLQLPELNPQHPKWKDAIKALKAKNTTIQSIRKSYSLSAENEKLLCKLSELEPAQQAT
jgi:hypothetical protein